MTAAAASPSGGAARPGRVIFGDFQTPDALASEVVGVIRAAYPDVGSVLEPTCGRGAFLVAAAEAYPGAPLLGFDLSPAYVSAARERATRAQIEIANFFATDWRKVLARLPEPVLVVGNPPWVTSSVLGSLDADNLPVKSNFKRHTGLDAMTGKSNFDISEWMLLHLLEAAQGRHVVLAMLCKASVARRVMVEAAARGLRVDGSVRSIDARVHFGAAVEAVLLVVQSGGWVEEAATSRVGDIELSRIGDIETSRRGAARWPIYSSLTATTPTRHMGVVEGKTCSDWHEYQRTRELEGTSEIEWRSGVKHDAARVMELRGSGARSQAGGALGLVNGYGQPVDLEADYVYPLLKGSDLAHLRLLANRRVIVTQTRIGADTSEIRDRAPLTWRYLDAYRAELERRKSSIYRGQPPFAMFGVGSYSFAPYKVAISALYKRLAFALIEPVDGRPVMLDDTCYFLPCVSREQGLELVHALNSPRAKAFFEARVFWDAKRPINKALLKSLSLSALLAAVPHAGMSPDDLGSPTGDVAIRGRRAPSASVG